MGVPGQDDRPDSWAGRDGDSRAPAAEETAGGSPAAGDEVLDLWSLPPGAVTLDDAALWGDAAALDRLASVLPILGQDLDVPPGPRAAPGDARPGPAGRADPGRADPGRPGGSRGVEPGAVGGSADAAGWPDRPGAFLGEGTPASAPGRHGRHRGRAMSRAARHGGTGTRGLPVLGFLVLLAAAYATAVAGTLAYQRYAGPDDRPEHPRTGIVVDGPLPCPMYRVSGSASATPTATGGCFFVG